MSSLTSPGLKSASDKTIIALRPYLERLAGVTLDLSSDFLDRTKTVAVPVIAGASEAFVKDSANYAHSTGTVKYVNIVCDQHKKATFELDDLDCLEIEDAPIWAKFAQASADKIGADIVRHALGKLTLAGAESQKTLAGVTLANAAKLAAETMKAGYDPSLCTLFLAPDTFFDLVAALPSGVVGNGDILSTARISGAMLGFGAIQAAPSISGALGYVVPQGALAVAARLPRPPKGGNGYVELGEQRDEVTGFSLQLRVHVDANNGATYLNVESVFGAGLTKGNANGAPGYIAVVAAS